jgi:hypothetical protein
LKDQRRKQSKWISGGKRYTIEWTKAKADWYDPTIAREDELFGKRGHEKDAEAKKLNQKCYWW